MFSCLQHIIFAGKGPCDRKAAVIKEEIRRFVNEKNDCCNNIQFMNAAKSTKHLSIYACNVTDVNKNKASLPDITKYSNIQFEFRSETRPTSSRPSAGIYLLYRTRNCNE